jgi:hypothetical protein
MKLSSRKQLLKESEDVLQQIRFEIKKSSLEEGFEMGDLFKNLVSSILDVLYKKYRKFRQSYYQNKLPYLIGIDLINRDDIEISTQSLKKLENLLFDILKDINTSPLLKSSLNKLVSAGVDARIARQKIQDYQFDRKIKKKYSNKELQQLIIAAKENHKNKLKIYDELLENKVKLIIKDILRDKKYKNFEEMVLKSITSGISGLKPGELDQIKNNYFKTVNDRVVDYINNEKVYHGKTSWERGPIEPRSLGGYTDD